MEFAEIRRLTIIGLFSDDTLFDLLVLKGGNAISLVYEFGGRASLDIDLSMEADFEDVSEAGRRIVVALERKFSEHGLLLFDTKFEPRPHTVRPGLPRWGGYQFEFKLIEKAKYAKLGGNLDAARRDAVVVGPGHQRRFKIDFSKYEYCAGKVERELNDYAIYVYSPEMIVIEKVRAICQQMPQYTLNSTKTGRARDFYDIHLLVTASNMDLMSVEHTVLLREIFAIKEVPLELLRRIADQHEFHRLDWPAVKDAVTGELLEFEFYFDFVLTQVAGILKSLGIE